METCPRHVLRRLRARYANLRHPWPPTVTGNAAAVPGSALTRLKLRRSGCVDSGVIGIRANTSAGLGANGGPSTLTAAHQVPPSPPATPADAAPAPPEPPKAKREDDPP